MVKNKRIVFLATRLKGYPKVLDIGTDHGYVLKEAFDKGFIHEAIASDLREQPLLSAKKNLENYPVTFVLSNGFLNIKESFDLALVAGMGAHLISDIMKHAPKGNEVYLLQPNDKYDVLREYLMHHGWTITDEWVIHDRFYYVLMEVKRGTMHLEKSDLILGPCLKTKSEAKDYYQWKLNQINQIIEHAKGSSRTSLEQRREIYQNALQLM
ncbi:MAG: SAM-dependent methyltransferase [Acholeplasma sp.]|jgi:tRNA (adenine22-N1)-methyltransferase|nr:MAG: SAM-dependent methyltransferase [Acholeplasma sp.]